MSFSLFPSLPPEIRIKIWHHACLPRVVTVCYDQGSDRCLSSSETPALLRATHESRVEAQRSYKLYFSTASYPARIYFNPYQDTLYLPRYREMGYDETLRDFKNIVKDEEGMLDEVRHLAIEHVDTSIKRPWEFYNKVALLRGFRKTEEVVLLLVGTGDQVGLAEGVSFVEPTESPEALLRIWLDFRQNFVMEEKLLENVARDMGKEYVQWDLPTIRIKSKARKVKEVM